MRLQWAQIKLRTHVCIRLIFYFTGVFTPMRIKTVAGTKDYYVDGGVLCNFPLHAYDGK